MDEGMRQAEQEKEAAFYRRKASQSAEPFVHICDGAYVDRPEDVTQIRIVSNLKEVSLYKDGQLMETQTGDQVFLFRVPIEGEHSIEAKAGDCKSVILIRKAGLPD